MGVISRSHHKSRALAPKSSIKVSNGQVNRGLFFLV